MQDIYTGTVMRSIKDGRTLSAGGSAESGASLVSYVNTQAT